MEDKKKRISVTVKANLKKRDPETGEIIEEIKTEEKVLRGKKARKLLKAKGVNLEALEEKGVDIGGPN